MFPNWFAQELFPHGGEKCPEGECRLDSINPRPAQSEGGCDPRSSGTEAVAKRPYLFGAVGRRLENVCGRLAPGTLAEQLYRFPCRSALEKMAKTTSSLPSWLGNVFSRRGCLPSR